MLLLWILFIFTRQKKDLDLRGLRGTLRLYLRLAYKSMDLTSYLQQQQIQQRLLYSRFCIWLKPGRIRSLRTLFNINNFSTTFKFSLKPTICQNIITANMIHIYSGLPNITVVYQITFLPSLGMFLYELVAPLRMEFSFQIYKLNYVCYCAFLKSVY